MSDFYVAFCLFLFLFLIPGETALVAVSLKRNSVIAVTEDNEGIIKDEVVAWMDTSEPELVIKSEVDNNVDKSDDNDNESDDYDDESDDNEDGMDSSKSDEKGDFFFFLFFGPIVKLCKFYISGNGKNFEIPPNI